MTPRIISNIKHKNRILAFSLTIAVFGLVRVSCEEWLGLTIQPPENQEASDNKVVVRWQIQESNTSASIRGICAVDDRTCWISGSGGTYARTSNGGKTWEARIVPQCEQVDFRDIEAFDAKSAILLSAGRPARIYKTIDGGQSWGEKYFNNSEGIFFNSMAFWDRNNGIAVSDPIDGRFFLIKTKDGGSSWERIPPDGLPESFPGEAGFAASGTCIAVQGSDHVWFGTGGIAARIFYSKDRGETWMAAETPMQKGASSQGIFSIGFKDPENGIIVGGDYRDPESRTGIAALSFNSGKRWILPQNSIPGGYRSCVAYLPNTPSTYIAIGKGGADITHDGGHTWHPLDSSGFYCLSIAKQGKIGWAAGSEGRIAKIIIE